MGVQANPSSTVYPYIQGGLPMETQPQVRTPTSMTTPSSSGDGFAIAEFQDMKMQPALERALGRRGLLKA